MTTFLREHLLYSTVQSILDNWNDNYRLLVGDQSYINKVDSEAARIRFDEKFADHQDKITYYSLPYDCGLSYARNYLVDEANNIGSEYCFLIADSQEFIAKYDTKIIIDFLESDKDNALVGFVGKPKPDPYWKWDIELVPNQYFLLSNPKRDSIEYKGYNFQPVDVVQNFFIAKTKVLLDSPWDNELKLTEHEDMFYRLKQKRYKIYFNDSIEYRYIKDISNSDYNNMRSRIYNIYKQKIQMKYNITGWMRCDRRSI